MSVVRHGRLVAETSFVLNMSPAKLLSHHLQAMLPDSATVYLQHTVNEAGLPVKLELQCFVSPLKEY